MEHIRRNRHRRRSAWVVTEEEFSSSSRAKRYRLNPEPIMSSESALSFPSIAEGEDTELTQNACGPDPSDIWNFAYRTSNVTRKKDLQDLPEAIVKTLNDFMLDALDLGNEDLQGYRLDAVKSSRSSYFSLGKSEEEREKRFNFLLERKTVYCSQIRICIAEALEDISYYRFYQGKLIPPKKYKTSQVGFGREDRSRMTWNGGGKRYT